jgi:hypothetical protein
MYDDGLIDNSRTADSSIVPRQSSIAMLHSRALVACAALGIALLTAAWRFLTFSGFNNDHYIYLAGAQQMVLGEWPVRDFVDPGWPLMYGVSAAARLLFGRELWVELLVVASALAIGAGFTLAVAARLSGSIALALMVTLLEIGINPRSFGYPKILLYAIAGWAFVAATRHMTHRRAVLLALLTVVAFLFRHDHGLYIGVGSFVAVALGSVREGAPVVLKRAAIFAAAGLSLLLPWAIFVQYQVGLVDYFEPALEFSRAEAEGTVLRSLPWIDTSGVPAAAHTNWEVWLFYLFYGIPVLSLWLAWSRARGGREPWAGESAGVAAIAVLAIVMNLGFIRTPLTARLPDASVPAAILGAWLLGVAFDVRATNLRRVALGVAAAVFVLTAGAVLVVGDVPGELNRAGILNRAGAMIDRIEDLSVRLRRTLPEGSQVPSRNSEALLPFYAFVERCSSPADRLIMTGLSPDVFVLANRGFAGGQMAYRPSFYASEKDQQKAIARMQRQSVPFVIVALEEETGVRGALPLVAAYIDAHYETLAHITVPGTRGLQIYVERGRRSASIDAATGWPCFSRPS